MKIGTPAAGPISNLLIPKDLGKNNFDLLRFLLAASVIYSHCFVLLYIKMKDVEPLRLVTQNQVDFGGIAVSFFFVISGFLIVRSFHHNPAFYNYFVKRILRIFPGFIAAFLASVFIIGLLGTGDAAHRWGHWRSYLHSLKLKRIAWQLATLEAPRGARTFASNPLPDMINESLWTIQYEFLCYVVVPLLGVAGMMKRRWIALLCFLIAYIVLALQTFNIVTFYGYDNIWNWVLPYPSEVPRFIAYFFAGTCVYLYRHSLVRNRQVAFLSVALLCVTAQWAPFVKLALPLAGVYLLFYVAYHPRAPFHRFAARGDFSYGLYLYGWPVQQLVVYLFAARLTAHQLFFTAFPITLLLAYGSWHLVEKRFLKMKHLLQNKKEVRVKPMQPIVES